MTGRGARYWWAMSVSLGMVFLGLAGIFAFPPTKADETWVRFVCFVGLTLVGMIALLVSALGCLAAAIAARRRGGRR